MRILLLSCMFVIFYLCYINKSQIIFIHIFININTKVLIFTINNNSSNTNELNNNQQSPTHPYMHNQPFTNPTSIQFPSFGPSLQTSPAKIEQSSTFQSLSSQQIHRISIHLPQEFLQNNQSYPYPQPQHLPIPLMTKITSSNTQYTDNSEQGFSNIKVYCRLRQPKKSNDTTIKYDTTMVDDGQNCYSFDYIFGRSATQQEIYDKIAKRHLNDFFMGKNSTVFAYGQTGSGKTYTMFGNMNQSQNYGIIPRTLKQIFKRQQLKNNQTISCSMLQIYNEKLMDLFNPLTNSNYQIKLKQFNDSIFLDGLQEILVQNQHQLFNLIRMGHKGRKIAATMNNDVSSRSHTILFVYRNFICRGQEHKVKLCFIDLAGSEKVRKSGAKGQTLQQTKKINLSLSCLGNVIHSLTNGSDHIPYRNSKLTRILKDSLCTDTSTSIITTCSMDSSDHQQTLSTIKFAIRAKKIKNKKKLDQEQEHNLEQQYLKLKKQLEQTKKQLEHYKRREIQEQQRTQVQIPEQVNRAMQPIPSICVISHGVSSRVKLSRSMQA